jgi:hypothetical protein
MAEDDEKPGDDEPWALLSSGDADTLAGDDDDEDDDGEDDDE